MSIRKSIIQLVDANAISIRTAGFSIIAFVPSTEAITLAEDVMHKHLMECRIDKVIYENRMTGYQITIREPWVYGCGLKDRQS